MSVYWWKWSLDFKRLYSHPAWLDDSQIPDTILEKAKEFQIEISLEQWQKLEPSQRFALIKLSPPPVAR